MHILKALGKCVYLLVAECGNVAVKLPLGDAVEVALGLCVTN